MVHLAEHEGHLAQRAEEDPMHDHVALEGELVVEHLLARRRADGSEAAQVRRSDPGTWVTDVSGHMGDTRDR